MVKKALLLTMFCFVSCLSTRTEYGNIRFKQTRFTIKPNSNNQVFKLIDTTKIYQLVDVVDTLYMQRLNFKKSFLKFYGNGKVGEFYFFSENDIKSLDPKRANMAYYNYDGKDLIIQFYFEHPQSGGLLKNKLYKVDRLNLRLIGKRTLSTYKINDLPKDFLIYKPDW